nr:unnamed protein product [Digitaria exilis]
MENVRTAKDMAKDGVEVEGAQENVNIVPGDSHKGVDGADDGVKENSDRRMVLVGEVDSVKGGEDEEDEFVFEEEDEVEQAPAKWMAIARFYSGQQFKTWVLFSELSKAWGQSLEVPVRDLCDNHFLVEFGSEWLWKKAVHGGPWTFKGDAVIFTPYDGMKRFSEIVIDSINLWVRIYDIPVKMM